MRRVANRTPTHESLRRGIATPFHRAYIEDMLGELAALADQIEAPGLAGLIRQAGDAATAMNAEGLARRRGATG
jgi:hypothetical protein